MVPAVTSYERPPSRYVTVGGRRLHYTMEGRGPTLLLLHGLFSSLAAWDGWAHALSGSFRVVRVDLPGFGESEQQASDDYSPEHALELLEQLTRSLELTRFHLAGSCLGGFLAWYFAANNPERVDRLILLSPLGNGEQLPALLSLYALPGVGRALARLASSAPLRPLLSKAIGDTCNGAPDEPARSLAALRGREARRSLVRQCRQLRANSKDRALRLNVHRIRSRTLLQWGACDSLVPVRNLDAWRRAVPTAEARVYDGLGHFPMLERAAETAADAHEFLTREADQVANPESAEHDLSELYARGA